MKIILPINISQEASKFSYTARQTRDNNTCRAFNDGQSEQWASNFRKQLFRIKGPCEPINVARVLQIPTFFQEAEEEGGFIVLVRGIGTCGQIQGRKSGRDALLRNILHIDNVWLRYCLLAWFGLFLKFLADAPDEFKRLANSVHRSFRLGRLEEHSASKSILEIGNGFSKFRLRRRKFDPWGDGGENDSSTPPARAQVEFQAPIADNPELAMFQYSRDEVEQELGRRILFSQ
jgi:hypothetical protein